MLQPALTPARSSAARTRLYALLCLTVAPPEPWHRDWMTAHLATLVRRLSAHLPLRGVRDGLLALPGALQLVTHREMLVEHARLDRLAPPYESFYRDGGSRLMGESAAAVQAAYARAGFAIDNGWRDLPDHLRAELEFMAALVEKEAQGWRRSDTEAVCRSLDSEADFLGDHLIRWVGDYARRIRSTEPLPYFLVLAEVLENAVLLDRQWVMGLRRHVVAARRWDNRVERAGGAWTGEATAAGTH